MVGWLWLPNHQLTPLPGAPAMCSPQWTLHLCDSQGHQPWRSPAIAMVVLGSLLVAGLVLANTLSR